MSPFGRLSSRAGRALEALALTGCLLGVAVGPAAAHHADQDPHCKQTGGTNACLWVTPIGADIYRVHVGIDVSMGEEDIEQAILHGSVLSASIQGEDGSKDQLLIKDVPLLGQGPGPNGYGGDFEVLASGRRLNEDSGRDEIVGKIRVFFPRTGQTFTYQTGQVNHEF
ncbi:MAG: hypothetical protein ACREYC_13515 [Gammaproteobacteria bacterium]